MKTIVEPKNNIVKLWGKQRIKEEATYRMMRYVLRVEQGGTVLLHNVVTGQLVEVEQDEIKALETLPAAFAPAMTQLVTDRFLVTEGFDEYKSVKQLRRIYQSRPTGTEISHYIILPTTFCNAHCFYCYESDYPRVQMTEETASRLINFIDEHREGKDVDIQWFGGEPLVGIRRIDQISQGLRDRGINYSASMISNGYLFDEKIIERSVELWKLYRVQITLDGTENTYNRVKAYVNVQDSPFQHVLNNIDLLTGRKVQVNIRLNVDFYNKDDIRVLIEELIQRYAGNQYVSVYLSMLFNDQGFEPVRHSYDEIIQMMHIIEDLSVRLKEAKMVADRLKPPNLQFSQCMADNPHTVMIQPDGSLCRCEHENIHDCYGNIRDGVTDPEKLEKWKESTEHSESCPSCPLYPACYSLRYCMDNDRPCIDILQKTNIEKQTERIRTLYDCKKEEMKSEGV